MHFVNKVTKDTYAIALGNFDGVHIGHQQVIKTATQKAKEIGCKSAVVTFSPHPAKILSKNKFTEILSLEDKISTIKALGVDEVIVINFTEDFSKMPAESFINELCQKFIIKSITTGYNFRFGHNRHGSIRTINSLKEQYNFEFNIINQVLYNGCQISSSILRQMINIGCVRLVSNFIGRDYTIDCVLLSKKNDYLIFKISNLDLLFPPNAVYLGQIDDDYCCVFLIGDQIIVKMLDNDINSTNQTRIKLLSILGQELCLDQTVVDDVKGMAYINKAKFCLN